MRKRLESLLVDVTPRVVRERIPIFAALRRVRAKGYHFADFRADLLAGLVVGVVALPLSMALSIAVGAPPEHGLYTAVVAGAVVALTGGSKFQVTGPTAAFVVILAPIVTKYGLSGLLTAGLMAGVILLIMGIARLGRFIQFIPHPVTTGFTAGIALVIATLQIKDICGIELGAMPDSYIDKLHALWNARGTTQLSELVVATATFALLVLIPRVLKRIPAPLIAITLVSVTVAVVHHFAPGFHVATIGSRFHSMVGGHEIAGIPPVPPHPILPWGNANLTYDHLRELAPAAFAIAMLGAIESLLSAVIADGMTGTRHDPNAELVGLGIGNIITPFFGGIAATGALARTATNVRAGARSPIAAVVHSVAVLLSIVLLARFVAYIPMASLAALLLLVAWNMAELRHSVKILRMAPKSDVFVLLTCFLLTVVFDMVVSVGVGVVLAALLFMRRMTDVVSGRTIYETDEIAREKLPDGVALYEIAGPLFFGAAKSAMDALDHIGEKARVVVLDLGRVPTIDASGLIALESACDELFRSKKRAIIAGPLPTPSRVFDRFSKTAYIVGSRREALALATKLTELPSAEAPPSRSLLPPDPDPGHA